MSDTLDSLDDI